MVEALSGRRGESAPVRALRSRRVAPCGRRIDRHRAPVAGAVGLDGRRDHVPPPGATGSIVSTGEPAGHRALGQANVDVGGAGGSTSASTRTAAVHFSIDEIRVAEDDLRAVLDRDDDALLGVLAQPLDPLREARRGGPRHEQRAQRARIRHLARRRPASPSARPASPSGGRRPRQDRAVAPPPAAGRPPPTTSAAGWRSVDLDPQAVREVRRRRGSSRPPGTSPTASSSSSARTWSVVMSSADGLEHRLDARAVLGREPGDLDVVDRHERRIAEPEVVEPAPGRAAMRAARTRRRRVRGLSDSRSGREPIQDGSAAMVRGSAAASSLTTGGFRPRAAQSYPAVRSRASASMSPAPRVSSTSPSLSSPRRSCSASLAPRGPVHGAPAGRVRGGGRHQPAAHAREVLRRPRARGRRRARPRRRQRERPPEVARQRLRARVQVRLEARHDALAAERARRLERRPHLGRVVGVVVVDPAPAGPVPCALEPAPGAHEGAQRARRRRRARRPPRGRRARPPARSARCAGPAPPARTPPRARAEARPQRQELGRPGVRDVGDHDARRVREAVERLLRAPRASRRSCGGRARRSSPPRPPATA